MLNYLDRFKIVSCPLKHDGFLIPNLIKTPLWSQKGNMLQNTWLQRNGCLSPKSNDNMNNSCVKTQTPRIWSKLKLTTNWLALNFVDFILFHPRPWKLWNVLCFECKSRTMGSLETFGNKVVVGWRFSVNFGNPWRARLGGHPWTTTNRLATGRKQYVEMSVVS